jgi:hypothetical protein
LSKCLINGLFGVYRYSCMKRVQLGEKGNLAELSMHDPNKPSFPAWVYVHTFNLLFPLRDQVVVRALRGVVG